MLIIQTDAYLCANKINFLYVSLTLIFILAYELNIKLMHGIHFNLLKFITKTIYKIQSTI